MLMHMNHDPNNWFDITKHCTLQLAHVRSVSPGKGEAVVAREVIRLLTDGGLEGAYTEIGLDAVPADPWGRQNAYAFLQGKSRRTVVLLGHIDTVDTSDFGALEPWACDPEALARHPDLLSLVPDAVADVTQQPDEWMFGRGVADMKSGVAATIAVMRNLASAGCPPLSVVLLATPDEEHESVGVLRAVEFLHHLRERFGLEYVGVINTDYTSALYPGDPHRYIYSGTIGKLLAGVFVVGCPAHAGEPFAGMDANVIAAELIRDLSMNAGLADSVRGVVAPPPATLRATDLKLHYDTQLPFMAYVLLNILTLRSDPGEVLARLREKALESLNRVLVRSIREEGKWLAQQPAAHWSPTPRREAVVLTYAELRSRVTEKIGPDRVGEAIRDVSAGEGGDMDKRDRCVQVIDRLWRLSGYDGPAAVIFYAPPYYPHVARSPSSLADAVHAVIESHQELPLVEGEFFPLMSDLSYLRLDSGVDVTALQCNMPVWQDAAEPANPAGYSLPFHRMRDLDLPVVNIGPYGRAAHQRGERVLMPYSFGVVPQLIYETIERLGTE